MQSHNGLKKRHQLSWTMFVIVFLISEVCCLEPSLEILPTQQVITKPVGKSVLITCKTRVEDPSLVTDFRWLDLHNRTIDKNNKLTRERFTTDKIPADKALALIIQPLQKNDAGVYTCMARYANSIDLIKTVTISPIVAVTWEDAPLEQFPLAGQDYRIRCKVKADPPPHVEWKLNGQQLTSTSGRFVEETDGLLIQQVTEADDGIYTCRAFVLETGELAERRIKVEVHTRPKMIDPDMVTSVEAIDGESASLHCKAHGKPPPQYSWIKTSTQKNLASAERFAVNDRTGILDITRVSKDDSGEFKCVAFNGAGSVEKSFRLLVIVRPQVMDIKNITVPTSKEARLECRASGNPLPAITFRKLSSPSRMVMGVQPNDDRIILEQREDRERGHSVGTLIISQIKRSDDGLYQCIAINKGGESFKNGHIEVQFAPTFEHTPMKEAWSWERRPVNLTCLAESIPNATISWRLNERDIDKDPNFRKIGNGPASTLLVTPSDIRFYGVYKCVAINQFGEAQHEISLRKAHVPGEVLEAKLDVVTATTITFIFTGPGDSGGRPIMGYAVQYKTDRQSWNEAYNKTWPVDTPYILEQLEPQVVYYMRFAAFNEVGRGTWSANRDVRMPRRSSPVEPLILNQKGLEDHIVSKFSDRFELRWKKPADNGDMIDTYEIEYCTVYYEDNEWRKSDKGCLKVVLKNPEATSHELEGLISNTRYKMELRAHNSYGNSLPAQIFVQTAQGEDSMMFHHENIDLTSSVLIGAVVAALLVILIIIDISCYFINDTGLLWLMCGKKKTQKPKPEDLKRNSEGKELLSNGNRDGKIKIESSPMLENGYKRDTAVEYDVKKSISRTSFVGKDSAV